MKIPGSSPLMVLAALLAANIHAQSDASRFSQVQGWTGTLSVAMQQAATNSGAGYTDHWTFSSGMNGVVNLKPDLRNTWSGGITGDWTINNQIATAQFGCTITNRINGHGDLAINAIGKTRTVALIQRPDGFQLSFDETGQVTSSTDTSCPDGGYHLPNAPTAPFSANWSSFTIPFPDAGYILKGSAVLNQPVLYTLYSYLLTGQPQPNLPYQISWNLQPVGVATPDLVLSADGYDGWRPQGGSDERTAGNSITVHAKLQNADGSSPKAKVVSFTYGFAKVSAERGVCINYPPQDKATYDNDLQFDPHLNPGLQVSGTFNSKATGPGSSATEGSIVVTSYDWGAAGTVTVIALLDDGSTVSGHLPNSSENLIRLPKRAQNSDIADVWKAQNNIPANAGDDDDQDALPVGDGNNGDGLTLYEEYRGFYENGVWKSGDPNKKDYFLVDLVGERAAMGIAVFRQQTQLAVHDKMLLSELAPDRVVNFNSLFDHQIVEQHGVIMKIDPDGVQPVAWSADDSKGPGPPKNTDEVRIPASIQGGSIPPGIRGPLDYYDKAVAHELMHTVSVWHHGDTDWKDVWNVIWPGDPVFPTDRTRIRSGIENQWVDVYTEDGVSVAALYNVLADRIRPLLDLMARQVGFASFTNFPLGTKLIGVPGGQHSGTEDCLMRYEFATAYPSNRAANEYYLYSETNGGAILCNSPAGTGANDPSFQPQSRHGAAAPRRGDCLHQINVNDLFNSVR